jgi:threonyl-tRNA synthetase
MALRFTKDFYEENKQFVADLVKIFGKPILAEMWAERFFYFRLKWDFNFVDNQDKAAALSTDQIDVENAKRYEITYTDDKGDKQFPLILHCSPSGAIERCVYALLEKAYREQQSGKLPMLPLWLSPTQVRLISMSEKYAEKVEEIAKEIEAHCVRVDIDDRAFTLQKRIREAETEWVPYVIVVGQREIESDALPVRDRAAHGKVQNMNLNELLIKIQGELKDKPFRPLPLPRNLSKRPQFYG